MPTKIAFAARGVETDNDLLHRPIRVTLLVLAALAGGVHKVIRTNETGRQEGQRTLEEWSLSTSQGKTQVDLAGVGNNECNTLSSSKNVSRVRGSADYLNRNLSGGRSGGDGFVRW